MKAHCPACGRTTRVAEDVLDFPVRCERCRTMLLARSLAAGIVGVKTEVLPLGRIPERFHATPRTDLVELLTHRRRGTFTAAARSVVRNSHATRGHGIAGLCMALVTAMMLTAVLGVGYWKLHVAVRPAAAAANNNVPSKNVTSGAETPPTVQSSPNAAITDFSLSSTNDKPSPAPQTSIGTGELFPDVPAKK